MNNTDRYILLDIQEQTSRLNGGVMYRITWYCVEDGTWWESTVDSAYNNFRRNSWDRLVHEASPWGAYQGLERTPRTTRTGVGVLTADSRPCLRVRVNDQQQAMDLVQLDQDLRTRRNQYGELFDVNQH